MKGQELAINEVATLFISFDLVNCTLYKTVNKGVWATGVSEVIGYIIDTFTRKSNEGYRFWKVLGDEVIFTKNIPFMFEVHDILEEIYQELTIFNHKISTGEIGDINTMKVLSVKSTVWVAGVSSSSKGVDNFYTEYKINDDKLQSEYLGTDIDAGFRISKYTSSNRMVISYELAAFFYKDRMLRRKLNKIHFLGFRTLKGIWENKPYPIFMYHGKSDTSFYESIEDEGALRSKLLTEYLTQLQEREVDEVHESYEEQLIAEFCSDSNLNEKVEQIITMVNEQNSYNVVASSSGLKVHYSVLCYAVDGDDVSFIITEDHKGCIGFGGAVIDHNLQYLDTVQLYYQKEFGVNLEFIKDVRYNDPIPLILSSYFVNVGETRLKGSVFLAKIDVDKFWGDLSEEYKARLIKKEEIHDFQFYDCENPLHDIIEQAMQYIKDTDNHI